MDAGLEHSGYNSRDGGFQGRKVCSPKSDDVGNVTQRNATNREFAFRKSSCKRQRGGVSMEPPEGGVVYMEDGKSIRKATSSVHTHMLKGLSCSAKCDSDGDELPARKSGLTVKFKQLSSERPSGAASFEDTGDVPGEKSLFQTSDEIKKSGKGTRQFHEHKPDWTNRYVVVPGGDGDLSASSAVLSSLLPRTSAAVRKRIGDSLFPIQLAVIPHLQQMLSLPYGAAQACDMCVHAPTGEGKTLCYAIPLADRLMATLVPRLRAAVLTPTRELALQVSEVFSMFTQPLLENLKHRPLESSALEHRSSSCVPSLGRTLRVQCLCGNANALKIRRLPGSLRDRICQMDDKLGSQLVFGERCATGGSTPDIVICTPGKFVEAAQEYIHQRERGLDNCVGFHFDSLRWLVIDEADRLLRQSYHDWVQITQRLEQLRSNDGANSHAKGSNLFSLPSKGPAIHKFLFSATMTKNPKILNDIMLYKPLFFFSKASGGITMPERLLQFFVLCSVERKPLFLIALLYQIANQCSAEAHSKHVDKVSFPTFDENEQADSECDGAPMPGEESHDILSKDPGRHINGHCAHAATRMRVVVFCKSRQATHRLTRLLQLHFGNSSRRLKEFVEPWDGDVKTGDPTLSANANTSNRYPSSIYEFSATLPQADRPRILRRLRSGAVHVLVCSDVAARGLDIARVDAVVHYDAPVKAQAYVHRAGRSARAHAAGYSYTLLSRDELASFRHRLQAKGLSFKNNIRKHTIPKSALRSLVKSYGDLLKDLQDVTTAEARGRLRPQDPLALS